MSELKAPLETICSSGSESVLGEEKMQKYLRPIFEATSRHMCLYVLRGRGGKLQVIQAPAEKNLVWSLSITDGEKMSLRKQKLTLPRSYRDVIAQMEQWMPRHLVI